LNLVSFAALPDGQNGYLVETGPLVHYLSTERDLLGPSAPASARGLLALGNPSYNTTRYAAASAVMSANAVARGGAADCAEFQRVRFGPLASTAGEIDDIAALWAASGADISKLTGAEATEAAFKNVAPRSRVIHLATHGFFLGSCGASGSHLRGVGGVYSPTTPSKTKNPLALSGLAMAGANQRKTAPPDEDDGILTAEEVTSLDLNGVEWAVLSACDTGLGEVRAGEGVFGLRRAFAAAGVRTTIMSLWSVGDRSTREWMKALYDARLTRNRSTAQALQDATLSILRHRRAQNLDTHPYFWAAFVAAGDWR
jgi:CHAT domain-containing protein